MFDFSSIKTEGVMSKLKFSPSSDFEYVFEVFMIWIFKIYAWRADSIEVIAEKNRFFANHMGIVYKIFYHYIIS